MLLCYRIIVNMTFYSEEESFDELIELFNNKQLFDNNFPSFPAGIPKDHLTYALLPLFTVKLKKRTKSQFVFFISGKNSTWHDEYVKSDNKLDVS